MMPCNRVIRKDQKSKTVEDYLVHYGVGVRCWPFEKFHDNIQGVYAKRIWEIRVNSLRESFWMSVLHADGLIL